jgi:palmitoyl-protein thioesterase
MKIVPMRDRDVYKNDLFGLKTLDLGNRIKKHIIPGYTHNDFPSNKQLFERYVLQYLN